MVIQFLDSSSGTFLAVTPERLQIRQLEPGKAALGALVDRAKKAEDGTAIVGEVETVFVPLINYAMDIAQAVPAPKVELATSIPDNPEFARKTKRSKRVN